MNTDKDRVTRKKERKRERCTDGEMLRQTQMYVAGVNILSSLFLYATLHLT